MFSFRECSKTLYILLYISCISPLVSRWEGCLVDKISILYITLNENLTDKLSWLQNSWFSLILQSPSSCNCTSLCSSNQLRFIFHAELYMRRSFFSNILCTVVFIISLHICISIAMLCTKRNMWTILLSPILNVDPSKQKNDNETTFYFPLYTWASKSTL